MRVALINTGKAEAVRELRKVVPAVHVDVITEARYRGQYDPGERLHLVEDVGRVTDVLETVMRLHRDAPFDAVLSPSERSLPAGGYIRSYLALPGTPYDVANRFTNKVAMKRALFDAGIPTAPGNAVVGVKQIRDTAERLGFPVLLKPAFGTASMGSRVFVDRVDLSSWAVTPEARELDAGCRQLLLERFLDVRREFHCDAVVMDGRSAVCVVSAYTSPVLGTIGRLMGGYTVPQGSREDIRVTELHEASVAALGMKSGVTHLEVLETADGLFVGEIACRPGGAGVAPNLKLARGLDLWRAFYLDSVGATLDCVLDDVHDETATHVWLKLPIAEGKVESVTTARDLHEIDGVVAVDMLAQSGDSLSPRIHSASTTGLVYLQLPDAEINTVEAAIARVRGAFRLDVKGPQ